MESSYQNRGLASSALLARYAACSQMECLQALHDPKPDVRSAAARNLILSKEHVVPLCEQLMIEPCLYTRIAISETLQSGSIETACIIVNYLGKRANHQYTDLSKRCSKKKSYPLPRDLFARTLGNMSPSIVSIFREGFPCRDSVWIREALDAYGFLLFYHPEAVIQEDVEILLMLSETWQKDAMILWKCMMAGSAIPFPEMKSLLAQFIDREDCMGEEARKSLAYIEKKIQMKGLAPTYR